MKNFIEYLGTKGIPEKNLAIVAAYAYDYMANNLKWLVSAFEEKDKEGYYVDHDMGDRIEDVLCDVRDEMCEGFSDEERGSFDYICELMSMSEGYEGCFIRCHKVISQRLFDEIVEYAMRNKVAAIEREFPYFYDAWEDYMENRARRASERG